MKVVRVLKPFGPYFPGDEPSFADADADHLIASGVAALKQADAPRFDLAAANRESGAKHLGNAPEPKLDAQTRAHVALSASQQPAPPPPAALPDRLPKGLKAAWESGSLTRKPVEGAPDPDLQFTVETASPEAKD